MIFHLNKWRVDLLRKHHKFNEFSEIEALMFVMFCIEKAMLI